MTDLHRTTLCPAKSSFLAPHMGILKFHQKTFLTHVVTVDGPLPGSYLRIFYPKKHLRETGILTFPKISYWPSLAWGKRRRYISQKNPQCSIYSSQFTLPFPHAVIKTIWSFWKIMMRNMTITYGIHVWILFVRCQIMDKSTKMLCWNLMIYCFKYISSKWDSSNLLK